MFIFMFTDFDKILFILLIFYLGSISNGSSKFWSDPMRLTCGLYKQIEEMF